MLQTVRNLIPMMLVGAWHSHSNADCEILRSSPERHTTEIEKHIAAMLKFDDSPDMVCRSVSRCLPLRSMPFLPFKRRNPEDLDEFSLCGRDRLIGEQILPSIFLKTTDGPQFFTERRAIIQPRCVKESVKRL